MFEIRIHATGSAGNAYSIIDGDHKILIDPGIRFKRLQKKTGFSLSKYDFILLSHEHKDHCRAIQNLIALGMKCFMSRGTRDFLGVTNDNVCIVISSQEFEQDNWRMLPFKTMHDAIEPLGFLIQSPSSKKICYTTDTARIDFKFSGVTHWIVEANYSEKLLAESDRPEAVKDRIRASHMSIENLCEFFKRQDLSATEEIYLIHLSDDNSDEKLFKKTLSDSIQSPGAGPGLTCEESSCTSGPICVKTFNDH